MLAVHPKPRLSTRVSSLDQMHCGSRPMSEIVSLCSRPEQPTFGALVALVKLIVILVKARLKRASFAVGVSCVGASVAGAAVEGDDVGTVGLDEVGKFVGAEEEGAKVNGAVVVGATVADVTGSVVDGVCVGHPVVGADVVLFGEDVDGVNDG